MREQLQDDFWKKLHANWTTEMFTIVKVPIP